MLDFRRRTKVPNYLGAKEQRRVLVLLALAFAVVLAVTQAGDPQKWFAQLGRAGDAENEPTRRAATSTAESEEDHALRAPGDRDSLFPGVRADYLSDVRDDEVFRPAESDAWFHLLAILEKSSQRELKAASLGRVGFRQLDQQAEEYRGRLVTVRGVVRAAKLAPAPQNAFGIKQYHQLWLQPQRDLPELVVVYALELPASFPLGTKLDATSAATGFFFKRWAYQARAGVTTAPLILARTVEWQRPPPAPPAAPPSERIVVAIVVALILAALIVGVFVLRTRGARHRPSPGEVDQVQTILASWEIADGVDPDETAESK